MSSSKKIESDDMQFENPNSKLIKKQDPKQQNSERQEKFSEFLKTEKLRKYKRMPRVYN